MTTANKSLFVRLPVGQSELDCWDTRVATAEDIDREVEAVKAKLSDETPRGPVMSAGSSTGIISPDGRVRFMFGDNFARQSNCFGGLKKGKRSDFLPLELKAFLTDGVSRAGRGQRVARGETIAPPVGAAPVTATAARVEIDPVERLKAIKDEESKLLELIAEKEKAAEAALENLALEVSEFFDIELETLKEVLKTANATDLASGMRAAKAHKS